MEGVNYCKNCESSMPQDDNSENDGLCGECSDKEATCLECGKQFVQDRDIQLCEDCVSKFDLDKLWEMHDNDKLDALDFNESEKMREQFRR